MKEGEHAQSHSRGSRGRRDRGPIPQKILGRADQMSALPERLKENEIVALNNARPELPRREAPHDLIEPRGDLVNCRTLRRVILDHVVDKRRHEAEPIALLRGNQLVAYGGFCVQTNLCEKHTNCAP